MARLFAAGLAMVGDRVSLEPIPVNGSPALLVRLDGELDSASRYGSRTGSSPSDTVRNPEKLSRAERKIPFNR